MQVSSLMEKLQRKYTQETNSIKNFKSIKLSVDEEIYKEARHTVQNLIRKRKKAYFEEKIKENTSNPKKIWKTLKQLGLPEKRLPCTEKKGTKTDPKKFRPISLVPIVSKIFEKVIHEQTMEYLTDNNILY